MKKIFYTVAVFALPLVAGAAFNSVEGALTQVAVIINKVIPIIIGLAVIAFLWGILQYVIAKDEDKRKEAVQVMIYGIIAIFVMVSVWGLVNILGNTLNLDPTVPRGPVIPIPN